MTGYIASLIREMRGSDESVSFDKIARELGVSKPQIVTIMNAGKGAGPKVEQAFADRKFKGSVDALRAAARDWAVMHRVLDAKLAQEAVLPRKVIVEPTYRYDSLRRVLTHPSNKNRWSAASVAAVEALDADEDPGEAWFTEALIALNAAIKVSIPKLPDRGASPLTGLDERVPPARKKR